MSKNYKTLSHLAKRIQLLSSIEMLMSWDQETHMPKGAIAVRADASELIAGIIHQEKISPAFSKALATLIDLNSGEIKDSELSDDKRASVREFRRDYLKQIKLPRAFVEELATLTSAARHTWAEARKHNQFKVFQPHLEKIIELNRKKADYWSYDTHPYDALADSFEPEIRTHVLTELFEKLKIPLINLFKKIQTKPKPPTPFFDLDYDHDKQFQFGKTILSAMGFQQRFSRLDESIHPMCSPLHPDDVRMTTRIHPNRFVANILCCTHEGGHGLYHSNLPPEHFGTPLCESASHGIDESQSRTWETVIGHSLPFWKCFFPKLQQLYPKNLSEVSLDTFYRGLNSVKPSLIRINSDEVSYNLHILIRFEIEKGLIEGSYEVKDLPDIWNEKMLSYLGITPNTDSEGCLQDIHWSLGAIGYFPTYTLGNLYALQFFQTFQKTFPDWEKRVEKGELAFIADWQKEHIHCHGRRYLPQELCEKVTEKPLSEEPYITYLTNKYTALYNLK